MHAPEDLILALVLFGTVLDGLASLITGLVPAEDVAPLRGGPRSRRAGLLSVVFTLFSHFAFLISFLLRTLLD